MYHSLVLTWYSSRYHMLNIESGIYEWVIYVHWFIQIPQPRYFTTRLKKRGRPPVSGDRQVSCKLLVCLHELDMSCHLTCKTKLLVYHHKLAMSCRLNCTNSLVCTWRVHMCYMPWWTRVTCVSHELDMSPRYDILPSVWHMKSPQYFLKNPYLFCKAPSTYSEKLPTYTKIGPHQLHSV